MLPPALLVLMATLKTVDYAKPTAVHHFIHSVLAAQLSNVWAVRKEPIFLEAAAYLGGVCYVCSRLVNITPTVLLHHMGVLPIRK